METRSPRIGARRTTRCDSASPMPSASTRPQRRATHAWVLPCLLLLASCAVTPSVTTAPAQACFIPRRELQPTPVPPLQDEVWGDLRKEADQDREALLQCNGDKSTVLQVLEKQNLQRSRSEPDSKP